MSATKTAGAGVRLQWRLCAAVLVTGGIGIVVWLLAVGRSSDAVPSAAGDLPPPAEASARQVHQFCGACHAYPPPDSFPRSAWRKQVRQGYDFFRDSRLQ